MDKTVMTREGFSKMSDDYNHLKSVKLAEALEALTEAREKGDISENAEYEVALQMIEEINMKIAKMSQILANVQIIEGAVDDGSVQLLTWVKFKNRKTGQDTEYKIVPENEISIREGKISPASPIGKALMGKRVGDVVAVEVPAGKIDLEILNVRVS